MTPSSTNWKMTVGEIGVVIQFPGDNAKPDLEAEN